MSWSLAWLQFVMFCITLMQNDTAAILHDGWWTLKSFIVLALFVGSMWIPNSPVIIGYMKFSRIVSVFFLSYQGMLMLIVAYVINDSLVGKVSDAGGGAGSCAGITLLTLFGILTVGNITWLVYQFIEFSACPGNLAILITTSIVLFVMYALVFFRTRTDASVFTSALVGSYCLYLQWSAMSSNTDKACNPFNENSNSGLNSTGNTITMMILGLIFTFAALFVVSATTHKAEDSNLTTDVNRALLEDEADSGEKVGDIEENGVKKTAEEMHVFPITRATIFFQLLLTLAAIYYAMLLTNWGNPVYLTQNASFFTPNNTSYWCQITAMWISMLIYLFSLLAPVCFPDRSFG